jgi:hypothetical protein
MKAILLDLDDDTRMRLERIVPAGSRRRAEFVRAAIRKALWEIEERATAAAYAVQPDASSDAYLEPSVWESQPRTRAVRRRSR